jgi:hypothetical protein
MYPALRQIGKQAPAFILGAQLDTDDVHRQRCRKLE